jgi:prepilin peptidase CpaA
MMLHATHVLTAAAAAALLFAALRDIAFRTVPNWVSALLAADGIVLRLLDHRLPAGLGCGLTVFALAAVCWWRGWLGGGDVKLLGTTAVLIRPGLILGYVSTVAFAGGGLALLYLLLEQVAPSPRPRRPASQLSHHRASLLTRILAVECRRIHRRASLPYAMAISTAALLMLAKG